MSTQKEYLVRVTDDPATTWNGTKLSAWLWVKFPADNPAAGEKLTAGSEPTVSGVVLRCAIGKAGGLHLNVDLGQPKIESP